MTLFDAIGEDVVRRCVTIFYQRAFEDPIIGHFFFGLDHAALVEKQFLFTAVLLGSKRHTPINRPIGEVHLPLKIRTAHFNRRHVLMLEVLTEEEVQPAYREAWLAREARFRPQVVGS